MHLLNHLERVRPCRYPLTLINCYFLFCFDFAECGTVGTGRRFAVGSARARHRLAARDIDDASAVGQRVESASQFAESTAAPIRRSRRSRYGQETASHAASRRLVRRPVRVRHGGDPLHWRKFIALSKVNWPSIQSQVMCYALSNFNDPPYYVSSSPESREPIE